MRVECKKTGKQFAGKCFNKARIQANKPIKDCFKNELRIIRRLSNENLVDYFELYEDLDELIIIMELLKGGELFDRVLSVKHYKEKDSALTIYHLLMALKYMDQRGIIHRDLKLENILLIGKANNYELKLADFGLSAFVDNINLFRHCGTPGYVAPEVLLDKDYETKADIFSAGVILFSLYGIPNP